MKKKNFINRINIVLNETLEIKYRVLLLVLSILLIFSFTMPIWQFKLTAPQYPKGLDIYIYLYTIKGGNNNHDIEEINTLNHYIGMKTLDREQLKDLDWIPFAIGLLLILGVRVSLIGNLRNLLDLLVISFYFTLFTAFRFIYTLYQLGHTLDPRAPVKIDPFMPVIFGEKQIANFNTWSFPTWGSFFLFSFIVGMIIIFILQVGKANKFKIKQIKN